MHTKRPFASLLAGLVLTSALTSASSFGADWKVLPGHVPTDLSRVQSTGQVDPARPMRLAIGVPPRDPAGLDDFLAQLYDPTSPNFRKYLTPEQFASRFGPTEQDYEAVKQFAQANGLTISKTHGNRLILDVTGPAAAVEKALHITLRTYQHPTEARQFYAPDTEPTVAADLPVVDVQGLSDFSKPHPKFKKSSLAKAVPHTGTSPDGQGAYFGDDFRNAYVPGTSLTGAGQTVGLLEFDGYYPGDIAAYASAAGGNRSSIDVENVSVDNFNEQPIGNGGDVEVALDIEMAMAMAPGLAQILVFEEEVDGPQNDILSSMAASNTVSCLSCSWGWNGPSTTTDTIFKQMASQGQSFFNASGDSDAFTTGATSVNGVDNTNLYNGPSSSPYITQVGGTTLTMNGLGASYASEKVWNWGLDNGAYVGSSGGVSSYYTIPSWQTGISMTANRGSTSQRNIPDVALTADNVFTYDSNGSPDEMGGTSCAAPLWAAFIALVNQQAASLGQPPAGFINPAIYAIGKGQRPGYSYAACFHDTTTGNNYWPSSSSKYPAATGYDLCTGWGTPNGASLIAALAQPLGNLAVSPQTISLISGIAGGPFTPASVAFQLTNFSASSIKWSLINTSAWFHLAVTNGALAGYSTASLGVNITTAANTLKAGSYSASLTVSNQTQKMSEALAITFQVNPALSVSPLQGVAVVGMAGGPFTPNSQSFVLSNLSASTQSWKLIKTNTWLSLSATNGVLAALGQTNVLVSLTSAANSLKAGTYSASLGLTNQTQKLNQEVAITLQVNPSLSWSPLQGFTAVGPVGGPFIPNSESYVLSNASGGTQSWKLTKTASWLAASATNGAVVAGGQTNLTMSLSSTATALSAGVYTAKLTVTNASGLIALVPFTLSVGQTLVSNGGFETGDFTSWTQSGDLEFTTVVKGLADYVHSGQYGAALGPTNAAGYLSQTITTVPGQDYVLSLWVRNASGLTPNWFQVQWNGTTLFDQQDFSVTAWTNLQFVVAASSASSVLQLGFQDIPDYLGLDDISLKATRATSVRALLGKAGAFHLVGTTRSNAVYQVQYKTNLAQPGWINFGQPVTANGGTLMLTHTNALGTSAQRFYRLLELP